VPDADTTSRPMIRRYALVLGLILAACKQTPTIDIPLTGIVLPEPDFANAHFVTTAEVNLRSGMEDETSVVAVLPAGTPLVKVIVGSECTCWKVAAPQGTGWLYRSYIAMREPPEVE
jgi:uncharacterized protein YraI